MKPVLSIVRSYIKQTLNSKHLATTTLTSWMSWMATRGSMSHLMELFYFTQQIWMPFFNSCYEFVKSEHHKREKKNFQLLFLTFAMSKFLLLKVPNENRVWKWASSFSACLHSLFFLYTFFINCAMKTILSGSRYEKADIY